jgi:putative ABC transport system permease protein
VLSGGFWRRRFGADPHIVGQRVRIDGKPFSIIGVLPGDFSFLWPDSAIFMPLTVDADFRSGRSTHSVAVLARARPGIDRGDAQTEIVRLARGVEQAYPATNDGWSAAVQPVFPLNKNLRPAFLVLLGAVGCVLFIGCVNVAGLLLVRAGVRQREMAIRTALGASRWRLLRQLFTESALIAGAGGIAGVLVAAGGLRMLVPLLPSVQVAGPLALTIDSRVLLFTLAITVATATLLGIAPIFQSGQTQGLRVSAQSGGHAGVGRALLAVQVALSLMLVVGAALLVRSLWNLQQVDPGFHADHLITMQLWLPPAKYASPARVTGFYEDVLRRLRRFPEVREAAVVNTRPFLGWRLGARVRLSGRPSLEHGEDPIVSFRVISPGYLTALGTPLIRGRGLVDSDGPASAGLRSSTKCWPIAFGQTRTRSAKPSAFDHSDRRPSRRGGRNR